MISKAHTTEYKIRKTETGTFRITSIVKKFGNTYLNFCAEVNSKNEATEIVQRLEKMGL